MIGVAQCRVVTFAHHAETRRLRRGGGPDRGPRNDAGALHDQVTHVVATESGDEALCVPGLPGLERRPLHGGNLGRSRAQVEQVDRTDVIPPRRTDERGLHRGLGVGRSLVAIQDLLGGELRESVLEKDREQRMIQRQANVNALHPVLEPHVAHAVEQLGTGEVSVRRRGGAQVENLPRPRTYREHLDLHEADDAFLRVLGNQHLLRDVGDRHERRQ